VGAEARPRVQLEEHVLGRVPPDLAAPVAIAGRGAARGAG
jgi:hypothetical protein